MSGFNRPPASFEHDASKYPYGECECIHGMCGCSRKAGPAAFEVTRGGKRMKLCTRCDLSNDVDKRLLVTKDDDASLFVEFDALGAFVIIGMIAGLDKPGEESLS